MQAPSCARFPGGRASMYRQSPRVGGRLMLALRPGPPGLSPAPGTTPNISAIREINAVPARRKKSLYNESAKSQTWLEGRASLSFGVASLQASSASARIRFPPTPASELSSSHQPRRATFHFISFHLFRLSLQSRHLITDE